MRQLSTPGMVILLFVGVAYSAHAQSLSAQQIMDRTISVYANCNSYVDEGEVRTIFLARNRRRTVIKPFTTAFVRPSDFRFEYKELRGEEVWSNYIIWKDAESVKTWWSIRPGVENPPNLSFAVAGATGVSSGSAVTVPALLMPEITSGNRIKTLSDLKLIGNEVINGRKAHKIEGTDFRKNNVTLWVDSESMLIVKIFQKTIFDTFETETTTTYRPQVNVSAQGKLAFNLPEIGKKGF